MSGALEARLKDIEARLSLLETPLSSEKLNVCAQCDKRYVESRNPEGACEFHPVPAGDSWASKPAVHACCGTTSPGCVRGSHRGEHHNEYPYAAHQKWFYDTLRDLKIVWADLNRPDLTADDSKTEACAQLGLLVRNDSSKLCVRAGRKLKVFTTATLPKEIKASELVLLEQKCGSGGFARITMLGPFAFLVEAKSTSDETLASVKVSLKVMNDTFSLDSLDDASSSAVPLPHMPALPPNNARGPEMVSDDPPEPMIYQQEGSTPHNLKLTLSGPLEVQSSFSSTNGRFNQYISGQLVVMNPSQSPVLVSEIRSEYLNRDRKWIPSKARPEHVGMRIDAAQALHVKQACSIEVNGEPGQTSDLRARLHVSLPSPLCVRFILEAADGSLISLKAEHVNAKIELTSKATVEKDRGTPILHWAQCDNVETQTRHFVYVYRDDSDGDVYVRTSVNSTTQFRLNSLLMAQVGYRAKLAGEKERLLDHMKAKCDDGEFTCYALVQNGIVYALKFILDTATGHTESYFAVPIGVSTGKNESVATLSLSGSNRVFRPNELVTVHWKSLTKRTTWDYLGVFHLYAAEGSTDYINSNVNVEGGKEGDVQIRLPIEVGEYSLRLIASGQCLAHSEKLVVRNQ